MGTAILGKKIKGIVICKVFKLRAKKIIHAIITDRIIT